MIGGSDQRHRTLTAVQATELPAFKRESTKYVCG